MAFILFYIGFYSIAATGAVARTSLLLLLPVRAVCWYYYFCTVTPSLLVLVCCCCCCHYYWTIIIWVFATEDWVLLPPRLDWLCIRPKLMSPILISPAQFSHYWNWQAWQCGSGFEPGTSKLALSPLTTKLSGGTICTQSSWQFYIHKSKKFAPTLQSL